jgi:hypothetical protein
MENNMSMYSTIRVTRTTAKHTLMEWLLSGITDGKLEDFMDMFLDHKLYNTELVEDGEPNQDHLVG